MHIRPLETDSVVFGAKNPENTRLLYGFVLASALVLGDAAEGVIDDLSPQVNTAATYASKAEPCQDIDPDIIGQNSTLIKHTIDELAKQPNRSTLIFSDIDAKRQRIIETAAKSAGLTMPTNINDIDLPEIIFGYPEGESAWFKLNTEYDYKIDGSKPSDAQMEAAIRSINQYYLSWPLEITKPSNIDTIYIPKSITANNPDDEFSHIQGYAIPDTAPNTMVISLDTAIHKTLIIGHEKAHLDAKRKYNAKMPCEFNSVDFAVGSSADNLQAYISPYAKTDPSEDWAETAMVAQNAFLVFAELQKAVDRNASPEDRILAKLAIAMSAYGNHQYYESMFTACQKDENYAYCIAPR